MEVLNDPVGVLNKMLVTALMGAGLPESGAGAIGMIIGVVLIATYCLLLPLYLIWFERRVVARMQDRVGPNRVGPNGALQTIADALKLLIKEDIMPIGADAVVYNLAPVLSVVAVISMWAVVPFASNIVGTSLNVGVLYIISIGSLGTLAIMMAGWSSNNKYALLGAFRTVAQLVSYEAPMILSMLIPVILAESMDMNTIVAKQEVWFIFSAPIAALIFFTTSVAEVGRTPFDLLEAESEIVAGFHIEYTGMKFAMFFVAEFMHAFTVGALTAVLFFGGWRGFGAESFPLLGVVWFMLKAFAGYFLIILMRASWPRIRIDHMLDFCWKFLTPLALAAIVITLLVDKLAVTIVAAPLDPWTRAGILFLANVGLGWLTVNLMSATARRAREAVEGHAAPGHHDAHGHDEHGHSAHGQTDAGHASSGHGEAHAAAH